MKKYAFHIQKGGVGKSTLSGNIAYFLGKSQKTILIDCDPQGSSSTWFLTDNHNVKYDLSNALSGQVAVKECIVKVTDSFFVLPTFSINGTLKNYAETKLNDEPYIFEDLCDELEKLDFQTAIFDLSPGMSKLEKSVLLAMDEVLTPLTPEFFSLDGIEIFNSELQKINKSYRKNIKHEKIIINNINRSFKRHNTIYDKMKTLDYNIFAIPQDSKIAESQLYNQSIFQYYPESKAIPELKKLAKVMEGK